jgi:hypothetical protein
VFEITNAKHLEKMIEKGLVAKVDAAQPKGNSKPSTVGSGASLVSGSASDTVSKVKETKGLELLKEMQAAELAKGEGARKTVLEALEAAIAAAETARA